MRNHNKIFSIGFEALKKETGKTEIDADEILAYIEAHPELLKDIDFEELSNFIIIQQVKEKIASIQTLLERLK